MKSVGCCAVGPDGALWFTNPGNNSIGRITTTGTVTNYKGHGIADPEGIITGPDGALWFTNAVPDGSIGRITTAGKVTTYCSGMFPNSVAAGPHGSVWAIDYTGKVCKINANGTTTRYAGVGTNPYNITPGPDGAMWYCNGIPEGSIGRIDYNGKVTNTYPGAGPDPYSIVAGPDGAMWFTLAYTSGIGRITTSESDFVVPFA
jgi:virginiamycin B lyase